MNAGKFKWLKSVIPAHIPHIYSGEMAQKSTIMSLPLLNANEAKYEDCVRILRSTSSGFQRFMSQRAYLIKYLMLTTLKYQRDQLHLAKQTLTRRIPLMIL